MIIYTSKAISLLIVVLLATMTWDRHLSAVNILIPPAYKPYKSFFGRLP